MKLSEVPFEKLKIGDKLISAIGNEGYISGLFREGTKDGRFCRYDEIDMEWINGNRSLYVFHTVCDKI